MSSETSPTAQADRPGLAPHRRVLVPLDGSAFAFGALEPAAAIARRLDVPVEGITVAEGGGWFDDAAARAPVEAAGAPLRVVPGHDPATAILRHGEDRGPELICMSTHGHGRVAGTFVGSVAEDVLRRSRSPLVAVGPAAWEAATGPGHTPPLSVPRLVACVDGTEPSEAVLPVVATWARALGLALTILIVAEPAPASALPDTAPAHHRGPLTGHAAEALVAELAARWSTPAQPVDGAVALDPIGPASGVEAHLREHPAGLLAVGTHARRGLERLWSGAAASRIVHAAPIPALVVPIAP